MTFHDDLDRIARQRQATDDPMTELPMTWAELLSLADTEVPAEYRGAALAPALADHLRGKPMVALLFGPPGCGKTRALWAAYRFARASAWSRRGPALRVPRGADGVQIARLRRDHRTQLLDLAEPLTIIGEIDLARAAMSDERWSRLDALINRPGILAVDDLGFAKPSRWQVEAVYALANERRKHQRPTWWTTNRTEAEIVTDYSPAIWSRINSGTSIALKGADQRQEQAQ